MDVYQTRPVTRYEKINKIGEGTYGTVCQPQQPQRTLTAAPSSASDPSDPQRSTIAPLCTDRARDKVTGEIVALKKIRMMKEKSGVRTPLASPPPLHPIAAAFVPSSSALLCPSLQFPLTSIREIKLLKALRHPHLVTLHCVAVGRRPDSIFLVFDFLPHDMASLIDRHLALSSSAQSATPFFTEGQVKRLVLQLLGATAYLHAHFVMHRDLKLSNLLLSTHGRIKVADFGLARVFSNPLDLYTPKVVTLWYRAPELLLGAQSASSYHSAIDVWSVGCILAELLLGRPLFPGQSEAEQLQLICRLLGTPNEKIWPGFASLAPALQLPHYPYNQLSVTFQGLGREGVNLLGRLLTYDPSKRITAEKALQHAWFAEQPQPTEEDRMPRWGDEKAGGSGSGVQTAPAAPPALRKRKGGPTEADDDDGAKNGKRAAHDRSEDD